MESPEPWVSTARRASRRFTTLEGWREVGQGVYAAAGSGIRTITVNPDFEPEYSFDNESITRPGRPPSSEKSIANSADLSDTTVGNMRFSRNIDGMNESLVLRELPRTPTNLRDPFSDAAAILEPPVKQVEQEVPEPPYHIFEKKQKWADLNVSLATVSLTITSYLVVQGISPLIWGSFSDALGRRPIYIYSFAVYITANIGLSFSPNFAVLLIFRGLQAAGSASTVSIGNGVIQDITQASDRGGFISFYQASMFSQTRYIAIGPVLGGLLSNFLGFRSIFVFLLILSSLTLAMIVVFLPETMRSIAGNGTLRLRGIYQPLIRKFSQEPPYMVDPDQSFELPKVTLRTFVEPAKLLKEKDILSSLIFGGVVYAIWSMVTSSTTGLFTENFHLNEFLLGLTFLPNGLGTIVGSTIIGKLLNRDYAMTEENYKSSHGFKANHKFSKKALPDDFPIERARLRNLWWITALFIVSTAGYGWTLSFPSFTSRRGAIALPLFFQFLIAATSNAVFAVNQTLVSDLCPGRGASSTALNNLVRCTVAAVGVAFIDKMIATLRVGPTFLALGFITLACVPLLTLEWYCGMGWRLARVEKERMRQKAEMDGP
ncbi:hypothetical protein MRS44_017271 [Fusarium solani]|uniref:uncharacterized protein n=1 Tax=Fusarium solani TaxID=169388 RepID=UPI0032C42A13|nr:hypothetical protein MRS44_017271 [Fusarium solani]